MTCGMSSGFCLALVAEDRDQRRTIHPVVGGEGQQVLRLATALWSGERAQQLGSPGFLAGAVGKGSYHGLPFEESAGRLSAADVHDAGCGGGGREPGQRVASAQASRTTIAVEGKANA